MLMLVMMMMRIGCTKCTRTTAHRWWWANGRRWRICAGPIRWRRRANITTVRRHRWRTNGQRSNRRRAIVSLWRWSAIVMGRRWRRRTAMILGRLLIMMGVCGVRCMGGRILMLMMHMQHTVASGRQLMCMVSGSGRCSCCRSGCIRWRRWTMMIRRHMLRMQTQIRCMIHARTERFTRQQHMWHMWRRRLHRQRR
ncbi:uncharacterized protein LOC116805617 isoform X1 [Drosophila grimshawi]|uniref:uncharacterized protein LOC116805617 isoform X1 n=1 Tax=Drosophila grimshawi TaxID=7222 RepID=UPI0013EF09FF|nr:uncharacterized protein LOC116805617 isoform X1 [Drosophila grimshawi]XP_032594497.1 uncharacterized protein LOC116805617 isoform X1 [Drosophila grimshawi]